MKTVLLIILIVNFSKVSKSQDELIFKPLIGKYVEVTAIYYDTLFCETYECLENNKDKKAIVQGVLLKEPCWGWTLLLSDKRTVLINVKSHFIETMCPLVGKKVLIRGEIAYGSMVGLLEDCQTTGINIDLSEISIFTTKTKKEWRSGVIKGIGKWK